MVREFICCDCAYCGDKYSFPMPNDLKYRYEGSLWMKHYYCCCGDSELYMKEITPLGIDRCKHFEEI